MGGEAAIMDGVPLPAPLPTSGDRGDIPGDMPMPTDDPQPPPPVNAGTLTAGEWNDNKNYGFLLNLGQNKDWASFESRWTVSVKDRVHVKVTDAGGAPAANVAVELLGAGGDVLFTARTDNSGDAYLFANLKSNTGGSSASVRVEGQTQGIEASKDVYEFSLARESSGGKSLDLMFVIDTTGSMSDELEYLKAELDGVIRQTARDNSNLPIRLSVNFYRDVGDDYVVRPTAFSTDINGQLDFLKAQHADGGGDFEEAVETALADALEKHDWDANATARLLFLVLDAPPHNTPQIVGEMHRLTAKAASMGVRIIPIASSGIDKDTEFLTRILAMATGGTYIFLTDHSGIGGGHLEPTIGEYEVELLNALLIRVINGYLA
jgi:hypothetical protein